LTILWSLGDRAPTGNGLTDPGQPQLEMVTAQRRELVMGGPGGAEQQPFLVGDLTQHLELQVVHELGELNAGQVPEPAERSTGSARAWTACRSTACSSASDAATSPAGSRPWAVSLIGTYQGSVAGWIPLCILAPRAIANGSRKTAPTAAAVL
jgi:hypothetical protein